MKLLFTILIGALIGAGCTTKSKARVEAREAFAAGQAQAFGQLQRTNVPDDLIQITGQVANPLIQWSEGLTLADALIEAQFQGLGDPGLIVINRQGQLITVKPRDLLRLQNNPALRPGDKIQIQR